MCNSKVSRSNSWIITPFLENYVTSEGAVSHNDLYYQQLPITRYQVRLIKKLLALTKKGKLLD